MILVIDNYDSFVYNLARYVDELGFNAKVVRNDAVTMQEILKWNPSHLIISPGPMTPLQSGISLEVVKELDTKIPILGVCLGHQIIGHVYGGVVCRAKFPRHGKMSLIQHNGQDLFAGLNNPLPVGRYHSLIVSDEALPNDLEVTAHCENGEIMAFRHREHRVFGVQFHPESVLTSHGKKLIENFLRQ